MFRSGTGRRLGSATQATLWPAATTLIVRSCRQAAVRTMVQDPLQAVGGCGVCRQALAAPEEALVTSHRPPFAASVTKLCGMHREAAPGPQTKEGGICLQNTSTRICGVEMNTGNVGCYSKDTCQDPSPMAPKLACFPDGHSAVNATELFANMSHFGSGNSIGVWNDEPKVVQRWNTLIRLVAKRRRMPDVFEVYDAMRALWVRADHGTTEFIARAAVATVGLSGLVDSFHTMPPARYPEVVFVGWSNVGKSSLINSLLHRTAVAPVSKMPGKTTQFHFYTINEQNAAFPQMTLVDVPGLGEAMADEMQIRHWRRTLDLYLKERGPTLRQVFHLISCEVLLRRQRPSPLDISVMEMCLNHRRDFNLDYTLVITKIDLIRNKIDAQTVYDNLRKVVRRLRLGKAKIVPASVRHTTGRVLLWKRLWRSVDPERDSRPARDLSMVRQDVERLVEAKDAETLLKLAAEESGDGWEFAVRGLLVLGRLRDAWRIIQAGPRKPQGLQAGEDEGEDSAIDNDMQMLKEGLLEAAEADGKEQDEDETELAEEAMEENAGVDFFQMPEDVESEQMAAMQERAALALGEAALAPATSTESETTPLAPCDAALADEVAAMLSREHRGAAAELLMEQVVAAARLESVESQFSDTFGQLDALLQRAKEDALYTPWSADRWNRLLRVVGSQRNLAAVEKVLNYMSEFQVTGDKDTDAVMAELAVESVELVHQAPGPCELDLNLLRIEAPQVLFLGGCTFSSRKGGPDRAAIADAVVSTVPRRRIQDEIAASSENLRKTRDQQSTPLQMQPLSSCKITCARKLFQQVSYDSLPQEFAFLIYASLNWRMPAWYQNDMMIAVHTPMYGSPLWNGQPSGAVGSTQLGWRAQTSCRGHSKAGALRNNRIGFDELSASSSILSTDEAQCCELGELCIIGRAVCSVLPGRSARWASALRLPCGEAGQAGQAEQAEQAQQAGQSEAVSAPPSVNESLLVSEDEPDAQRIRRYQSGFSRGGYLSSTAYTNSAEFKTE
ncbi:engB [Symbiodinium natans]|uniref:EngB protein n=1 Tax=Symbiodinium natans TaxID=878477 RepID=A0A812GT93_9DINO|nr:engB [Symbiodinium natans]